MTSPIAQPSFWQLPLADRMAKFAEIREQDPFAPVEVENPLSGATETFYAVTRYDDVVEISRRPQEFCSGEGAVSIHDMPAEALEFFGSFINMDDPRHARQRAIVGALVLAAGDRRACWTRCETICTEVIDGFCEQGEVDLVQVMSQPFPLLVICDMMGIPRSEFDTVLEATNVILGARRPRVHRRQRRHGRRAVRSRPELTTLMNDVAGERRENPTDDLTSQLVHNDLGEDMLAPEEIAPFFILLAVAGNDTTRTAISHGMHLLAPEPRAAPDLAGRPRRRHADGGRGDRAGRVAGDVHAPHGDHRRDACRATTSSKGDKVVLFYGAANRDPREFDEPETFDVPSRPESPRRLRRARAALLPRRPPRPARGVGGVPSAADPPARHRGDRRAVPLEAAGIPLVGGIKRLPVKFTPTAKLGAG